MQCALRFAQVRGFSNARFKGFRTHGEAEEFLHAGGGPLEALHSLGGVHKKQRGRQQQDAEAYTDIMEAPLYATAAAQHFAAAPYAAASQQPVLPPVVDPDDYYRLVMRCPRPAVTPPVCSYLRFAAELPPCNCNSPSGGDPMHPHLLILK